MSVQRNVSKFHRDLRIAVIVHLPVQVHATDMNCNLLSIDHQHVIIAYLRCVHSLTPRWCRCHALHPSCLLFIEPTISLLVMRSTSFVALARLNFESITHSNMFVGSSCYVRRPVIVSAFAPLLIYCCTFLCSIIEDLCKLSRICIEMQ